MRVALAAAGTRGDVMPLLALGQALRRRGHEVTLAASPSFAAECAENDLAFVPMGRDVERWLREEGAKLSATPLSLLRLLGRALNAELEAQYTVLPAVAARADVLVGGGALVVGGSIAQASRIPYRYAAFTPQTLPSSEHMPTVLPFQGAPRWVNALAWRASNWVFDRLLLASLNRGRGALGLAHVKSVLEQFLPVGQVVLALDAELACSSVAAGVPCTGAWQPSTTDELPERASVFLERKGDSGRAIFAGFGSMPDPTPELTAAMVVQVARSAGRRVILSGPAHLAADDVLVLEGPVSHARLFEHVDVVIHHGGAGTTTTAARAGVAQIIVPHGGDQFGFARRAHELGVAPAPFARRALTVERLEKALRAAMSNELRASARGLAQRLAGRDGCEAMVTHLEALVSGSAPAEG